MMGLPFVSFAVAVSVMELPLVTVVFPVMVTLPSTGAALVTVTVCVAVLSRPPYVALTVMVAVPALEPVTVAVADVPELFTVALLLFELHE